VFSLFHDAIKYILIIKQITKNPFVNLFAVLRYDNSAIPVQIQHLPLAEGLVNTILIPDESFWILVPGVGLAIY